MKNMTSKEYQNLKLAAKNFKTVCVSFNDYNYIVNRFESTDINYLSIKIYGSDIIMDNQLEDGYIQVSNKELFLKLKTIDSGISQPIKLNDFDRVLELKAFW